jgi:hypothetical protein
LIDGGRGARSEKREARSGPGLLKDSEQSIVHRRDAESTEKETILRQDEKALDW